MHPALIPMLGLSGQAGFTLAAAGLLNAPASLSRAQTASATTALGSDGATWQSFGANLARFNGSARRLLIEGQRVNAARNPRGEGATPGTPGTMPTHWTAATTVDGISRQLVGTGIEGGLPYVDLRFFGTPTATGALATIRPDTVGGIAAAVGQTWTSSFFLRLVAGSLGNITVNRQLGEFNSSFGFLTATGSAMVPTAAPLAAQRFQHTRTLSAATVAFVCETIFLAYTVGLALDVTLRIGAPQMEQGAFASTPILPPLGAPAASTRGGDLVVASLSALGIGGNGACTVLLSCVIPQNTPSDGAFGFFAVDDGTALTRFSARTNIAQGILGERILAGAGIGTPTTFTYTPGVPIRFGATIIGDGTMRVFAAGGTVQGLAGGPTSGLTTLRVGINAAGGVSLFGEVGTLRVIPFAMSDAALQAQVVALP